MLSLKYLRIVTALEPGLAWSQNITPLVKHTRKSMEAWGDLPLNTLGKVAILKMMLLPKYIYVMQNYPRCIPADWFRTTNALLHSFICGNKPDVYPTPNVVNLRSMVVWP